MTHRSRHHEPHGALGEPDAVAIAETLRALASPTRLRLLDALRRAPHTVGELVDAVGMEQSAVSHQLRVLRDVRLVVAQRDGRHVHYALHDDHVAELLDQAASHAEHVRLGQSASLAAATGTPDALEPSR